MNRVSETADAQNALASFYDRIPYDAQPYADARPAYLGALGVLHGLQAARPSACRVLELGCASGGNLIPLAWYQRQSEFVGIDLSAGQIETGRELLRALGLDNCTLHAGDLAAFRPDEQGFDYVIAHGVYSWVPEPVRQTILGLCRSVLRPGGIAYISYNTLPGWRMRGVTRDLLEWHLRDIGPAEQRLARATSLIDHLAAAVDTDSPGSFLEMEVARIRARPPSYLAHEFLEPENRAFLFHDFVDDAARAGLRYLCNADLATAFPELYHELGEAMADLSDDPVSLEQYLDFVAGRAFRQSLLCRDDEPPTELDPERIRELTLLADLRAPAKLDLRRARAQAFSAQDGSEVEVCHPLCKAVVGMLAASYPNGRRYPELLDAARQQVRERGDARHADDLQGAFAELFGLLVTQHIEPVIEAPAVTVERAARPRVNRLAISQARMGWSHVATLAHRSLDLDPFARTLLGMLDGSRERAELNHAMFDWLTAGKTLDEAAQRQARRNVDASVTRLLKLFARNGLFEAAQ